MFVILAVSDSDKHFDIAIKEYQKRFGKKLKIENIKPSKNGTHIQIIQKDTQNIIDIISKRFGSYKKVLLSKDGKSLDTDQIFDFCKKNNDIVFIIGGPYGLDEKLLENDIDLKLGFGKITIQHGLAKLILLEQVYRVDMISQNRNYHY
ncbi:23S rRNA (pseudouridine(1915)-N(3))-methyltransferase RlmH [Candidatus Gracilibacteria bacterium]|nr:23S rRNA (pseudouridine(1915)-N(3))-methyltransferase RlmH [Candidatus Gracilibacteria bacterium]